MGEVLSKMAVKHNNRYIKIRVKFEDDGRLLMSESLKSKGLTRTLHFLDPKRYKTVSDLISYIIGTLGLENVCPTDILLSINGYSLLPSVKTRRLNDEVICVTKITAGGELLPIDVLSDMDRSEAKKRKTSTPGSDQFKGIVSKKRRKNNKICPTETCPVAPQHVKNDIPLKQIEHLESPGSDELADGTAIEHLDSPGSDELADGSAKMAVKHNNRYIKIRVKFEDDGRLLMSESQKSKGLTRTLHFLDPKRYKTVSDLISYIIGTLGLENVCPTDILLSINGYSLLPSVKTRRLNDEVICVTKITAGGELLPIDVLSDMDRSEAKKRKTSTPGSDQFKGIVSKKRRKNNKICPTETCPVAPQHVKNDIPLKQIEHLESPGSDELADGTAIEHLDSPGSDELADGTAIEHLDSPGSDELADGTAIESPGSDELADGSAKLGEIGAMLSYETLGLSSDDVMLMTATCNIMGPHYGPMSVLYYLRCFLIFHPPWGAEVVGIKELLNRVSLDEKQTQKGLEDVVVNNDASKATETSKNDDPAVELAVDAEGSKKSMKVDDTKRAPSLATVTPSCGAIKFAEGIVTFCKLLTLENVTECFMDDMFSALVSGIIKDILTVNLLARAHQLFVEQYQSIMLSESAYDSDEAELRWCRLKQRLWV